MPSKSAEIQDQINTIDTQIQAGAPQGQIDRLNDQKTDLEKQLSAALADEASQAERTQAQEQAVESITLPYDFNDILSDESYKNELGQPHIITNANNMMIEVVKDFKRQDNADHNAERDQVKAGYEERLKAADDRETQLQRQNSELQTAVQAVEDQNRILEGIIGVAKLNIEDAESKRDAAVTEKEGLELLLSEKQAQIEQLRQDLANAPAPKQSIDITPTDKLAQMVKESAEQKAARGLARWNQSNPDLAVAPLEFPVLPTMASGSVEQSNPEQVSQPSEIPSTHPEGDTSTTGNQPVEQVVAQAAEETPVMQDIPVTRQEIDEFKAEHEALKARVATIERHANIQAVA